MNGILKGKLSGQFILIGEPKLIKSYGRVTLEDVLPSRKGISLVGAHFTSPCISTINCAENGFI